MIYEVSLKQRYGYRRDGSSVELEWVQITSMVKETDLLSYAPGYYAKLPEGEDILVLRLTERERSGTLVT